MTLISLAAVAAAALYYAWRLPETLMQDETQLIYTQRGTFDYTVYLKPNTVYGGLTELEPRTSYFAVLVESFQMTYDFELSLQDPVGNALPVPAESMVEYEVVAILREGDLWSREQILVPLRSMMGAELDLSFQLPIQAYQAEAEAIRAEVNTPGREVEVEVQVRIWPTVRTSAGLVQPDYVHGFSFRWQSSELVVGGSPIHEETATLGESVVIPYPQRALITEISTAALGVLSVLLFVWAAVSLWAVRSPFSVQQLTSELHRRYGDVIVEAVSLPASAPHQIVVHLRSLEDIGRTAHELMKPIILVQHEGERCYVVIDGADNVRYEVRIPIQPAKPSSHGLPPHRESKVEGGKVEQSTLEDHSGTIAQGFQHEKLSTVTAVLPSIETRNETKNDEPAYSNGQTRFG
ncbi:hypothetical protein GC175_22080 [bacterium]|nr:hypothetical protein [bacterium]